MVSRRGWIFGVAGTVGVGGWAYTTNESVSGTVESAVSSTSNPLGPPSTETKIGEATAGTRPEINDQGEIEDVPRGVIVRIDFYESGAAIVHPKASHGCFDGFALLHQANSLGLTSDGSADTSDALRNWEFGEFDEPITIDLSDAISQKDNYPNRQFKLKSISTDGACIAPDSEFNFRVPEQMM